LLGAVELELGGCIFATIAGNACAAFLLSRTLSYSVCYAPGILAEKVVIETAGDDILYWRDAAGVHHVPKAPSLGSNP
jgi:hypothetical protein